MSGTGPSRLGADKTQFGGAIDRARTIRFSFDGKSFTGFAGDTLASALLASGIRTLSRSFKFHRPRGVFTCGIEEPNALVQVGKGAVSVPSTRSTMLELHEGLETFSHAGWPSLNTDLGRVLDFVSLLWAAGFYNKTFKWPSWHTYEDLIRRMAGSGHAPTGPDPDRYEWRNVHCDVLVIGGGIAGLREALTAADAGSRVVLADQDVAMGGRGVWDGSQIEGTSAASWARMAGEKLRRADNVTVLSRTSAVGYYERDVVTLLERVPVHQARPGMPRECYWIVRANRVILATGAIEQPLIFDNNDRPGILLAGAAQQYLRRYAVAVGRRVIIATNNDTAYALARDLKEAGVTVLGVADSRHEVPQARAAELSALSIPLWAACIPVDTGGFSTLSNVTLGKLAREGGSIVSQERHVCDALAVSGGWTPSLHLYSQAAGALAYREETRSLAPLNEHPVAKPVLSTTQQTGLGPRHSPVGKSSRQWVDLRHDVTVSDLELALRENFTSIEHVKRYTTVGMSVDQGKTSNLPALEIIARLRGRKPAQIGHTTFRPPYVPVTLGAITGRGSGPFFAPSRTTTLYEWHAAHGAVLEDYGEWKRPAVYLRPGESRHEGIMREARAVRSSAGLFDGSPLGKIELHGPDALEFCDRFYINNLKTLKPGRARYGLMLRESGTLLDDGTVVMLAPDRLLITTTSGGAHRVTAWMEEWRQCEWPQLRVTITQVTDAWGTVSLTGPRSREILATLDSDVDWSGTAFPHLGLREGRLLGAPARIYRVSFTGELTYEINVPASAAPTLWEALLKAGAPYDIQAFGVESLLQMRIEKGFLHVGADTDGTTVPDDVGWGKVAAGKSADFIGKRSLSLPENVRPDRLQLIGLSSESLIPIGSHLRLPDSDQPTDGWVTSAGRAALTGAPVALALLRAGRGKTGVEVSVHNMGAITHAKVVEPPFYDPAGERMNG